MLVALLVGYVLSRGAAAAAPASGHYRVVAVLDGDTLDAIDGQGHRQRLRLLGIDAPEEAHDGAPAACGARAATVRLRSLTPPGSTVDVQHDVLADQSDRYGRELVYVTTEDGDVGEALLQGGLVAAWHPASTSPPTRYAQYRAVESEARQDRRGSWASCSRLGR